MVAEAPQRLGRLLEELEHFGVKLGLGRMRRLLADLGSPERQLPVVLVAGTNGKGSTSAWLASILTAAGYRSGLYTSPHLERVEERLRVDGRWVDSDTLTDLLEEVVAVSRRGGGQTVTYFEALTAAAILHFQRREVDLAVLEVGLGGRLDATNVCDPVLSLITSISRDHQTQLGDSLAEIARQKAGILRPGRPALSSVTPGEARDALGAAALEIGADLDFTDRLLEMGRIGAVEDGERLEIGSRTRRYQLRSRLAGAHQRENLALAVAAAEALAAAGRPAIDAAAIERGVAACRWPGRLESVRLPGRSVILDGAHNPAGLEALEAHLRWRRRSWALVFGMLRDRVDAAVVARLWEGAEAVFVTRPRDDRALSGEELARQVGRSPSEIFAEAPAALAHALERHESVVVCGSLYLVGELRSWLRSTYGRPAASARLFG